MSEFSLAELAFRHAPPAVHGQHLAGDKFRFVAHEINRGRVQIFRPADPSAVQGLLGFDEIQNGFVALRATVFAWFTE